MKKHLFLFLTLVGLSLISCNSDDDGGSPSIVGKWEYFQEGFEVDGQENLDDYNHAVGCNKDTAQYNSNGTVQEVYYSNDGSGCVEDSDTYSYTISGNTITNNFGSESLTGTFSISNNILKIKYTESGTTYVVTYKKI